MQTIFYSKDADVEAPIAKIYESIKKTIGDVDVIFAGGSTRKLFTGEDLGKSDIDMFFKSAEDLNRAKHALEERRIALSMFQNSYSGVVTKNELTPDGYVEFTWPNNMSDVAYFKVLADPGFVPVKFQLIHKEYFGSAAELLKAFDFTPTQFAYQDGKLIYSNLAFASLVSGNFYKVPTNDRATIARVVKMIRSGFKVTDQVFYSTFIKGRTTLEQYSDEVTINEFYEKP